jgi:NAD(P)-dependent dehydrogenase (short-subunit alcohol dehydrogenase family)
VALVIDTNFNRPFLARAATPHLIAAGWGSIINVAVAHREADRAGRGPLVLSLADDGES